MKTHLTITCALFLIACQAPQSQRFDNRNHANSNTNVNDTHVGVCGDGVLDLGEQCDDGPQNSDTRPGACRTDCRSARCGDGVIDQGEQCDSSNVSGNTCAVLGFTRGALSCDPVSCTYDVSRCSTCGDGTAEGQEGDPQYEVCDGDDLRGQDCISIGQASGLLACNADCGWDVSGCTGGGPVCGNGIQEVGEQCDDGNADNCDGCNSTCQIEECGNGSVDCGEECDDGNNQDGDGCTASCELEVPAVCGNGVVEPGEECDDGNHDNTDACPDGPGGTCQFARCGDGFVWAGVEGCDDGNGLNGDLCPDGPGGTCQLATCGDGHVWLGQEVCDPGSDPLCNTDCQGSCGDGHWNPLDEACDDGNNQGGDSCTADCQRFCGDGIVDADLGEECDLGNGLWYGQSSGGGVDSSGWGTVYCTWNCRISVCGDGVCDCGIEDATNCAQDCIVGNTWCATCDANHECIWATF